MTRPRQSRAARLFNSAQRSARCLTLAAVACLSVTAFAAAQSALPIFVADFNHDGIPDALVLSTSTPTATVALGSVPYGTFNGNAKGITFPAACTSLYTGTGGAAPIVIGDFNTDGFPDIAFRCRTNPQLGADGLAGVMLGNGDGTFAAPVILPTYTSTETVLGDFDHDGKLDVVLVGQSTTSSYGLLFYKGNGDGTFAAPSNLPFGTSSTFNPNFVIESAAAADVNGDGYLDLVTESIFSASSDPTGAPRILSVFGNNQDGTFGQVVSGATVPNTTVTLGLYPDVNAFTVLPANVYGSGKPDFIVPDIGAAPGILAVKNTSTLTTYSLATPVRTPFPGLTDARPGTFTGTAFSDIAVASATGITILANDGAGNLTASYSALTALLPAVGQPVIDPFALADANSDTYSDIYTATQDTTLQLNVSLVNGSATATAAPITLGIGTKDVSAAWSGNVNFSGATATGTQTVQGVPALVIVTSSKNPATLGDPVTFNVSVGPLSASTIIPTGALVLQSDGVTIASGTLSPSGTFSFATSQLTQGPHAIQAIYAGDTLFAGALSATLTQTINHLVAVRPTLTWPTPAPITYGTPLSSAQLDAVATDANGTTIPGTYTYTPPAGTVLKPGNQTLSVAFTPADATNFTGATATVQVLVTGLSSSSVSPSTVILGAGDTTITLTGSGFSSSAVVQVNGSPIATTVVNPTTLTAIVPAADFVKSGTLTIVVVDPSISQTTAPLTLIVAPASPQVTLSGPSTVTPGTQPTLSFALQNPYPVMLNGDFDLSFVPAVNPPVDDPAVQFATGGRTLTFTVPANSTTVPTVQIQSGTVAGTITIPLVLTANGADVTPTSIQPVVIVIPAAVPAVSSATMTKSGDQLTVVIHGFSNTREVAQATFHFVGISGAQIDTPDVTVQVGPTFAAWYSSAASDQYGSTFTYTQAFTVGGGAANIESVQVTLTNTVGASVMQTAQ